MRTRPPAQANGEPSGACSVGYNPRVVNHAGVRAYQSPPFSTLRTIDPSPPRSTAINSNGVTTAAHTTGTRARQLITQSHLS